MYKLKLHKNLTKKKWRRFSETERILMIANEINRAKNLLKNGDQQEAMNSYDRAFELLDLTISLVKKYNLLRELLRFREMLSLQYISDKKDIKINQKLIDTLISLNSHAYRLLNQQRQ